MPMRSIIFHNMSLKLNKLFRKTSFLFKQKAIHLKPQKSSFMPFFNNKTQTVVNETR